MSRPPFYLSPHTLALSTHSLVIKLVAVVAEHGADAHARDDDALGGVARGAHGNDWGGDKEGKREVSRALFVRACAICPSPTQRVPLPNSASPRPRFLLPAGAMGGSEGRVVRARSPGLPARRSRGREDRPQSSGVAVCAPASQAGLVHRPTHLPRSSRPQRTTGGWAGGRKSEARPTDRAGTTKAVATGQSRPPPSRPLSPSHSPRRADGRARAPAAGRLLVCSERMVAEKSGAERDGRVKKKAAREWRSTREREEGQAACASPRFLRPRSACWCCFPLAPI